MFDLNLIYRLRFEVAAREGNRWNSLQHFISAEDSKTTFFNDDDFKEEAPKGTPKKGSEEKMTYKNFIRKTLMQEGADAIAKEEDEIETKKKKRNTTKTPAEEQRDLQAEIRAAAHSAEADEQDLFSIKEQTLEEAWREPAAPA